jgi:hypothetical protein
MILSVSPLSSKTNNCYNITSVILTIYFCPLKLDILKSLYYIGKYFQSIIHARLVYSLVSCLFIKQDQIISTCNSAIASLMLSQFFTYTVVQHDFQIRCYSTATGWVPLAEKELLTLPQHTDLPCFQCGSWC